MKCTLHKNGGFLVTHPNVYICLQGTLSKLWCSDSVKFSPLFTTTIFQADFLEYFPWYLQIARGWVWLILIKFNLFWWSSWKRPKCCLRSVCELSDKTARPSITSAPAPGVGKVLVSDAHWPTCTLALTPGRSPNSNCQFIHFHHDIKSHCLLPLSVSNQQCCSPSISTAHLVKGEE